MKIQKIRPMEREPGKAKQETTKIADHMSTDSDKSPNGVCNFAFLDFQGFCMVCSRWPEPRKSKKPPKKKLQTTCPQSQTRAPMGSAVLFFVSCGFSRFLHGLLQMARTSEIQKKKQKTKLQTTCPQNQTRAPMGSAILFFVFFDFRGFCMVCSRWPEPRKSKKYKKEQNFRPHVHRIRQEPQWGLQFCFLFFCIFEVFAWSAPDGQNLENQKKNKTKLQTTCPQSQTRAPMGSTVLVFLFFWIFEVSGLFFFFGGVFLVSQALQSCFFFGLHVSFGLFTQCKRQMQ